MGDQYRVIRCPLGLVELWDHLAQNPSIANRVEVVEIQRQKGGFAFESLSPVVVPGEFLTTAQEFVGNGRPYHTFLKEYLPGAWLAEKSLIGAIKNMSGLQSFKWCREPPLIDSQLDGLKDDIWTALRSCETLRELHVLDAGDNEILDETEADSSLWMTFRPIQTSQIFTLSSLTTFWYRTYPSRRVPMQALNEMLQHRCPLLESISLLFALYGNGHPQSNTGITTVDLSPLFSAVRWPHLSTLNLYGVHLTPSAAIHFFSTHPSLSSIRVIEGVAARFIKSPSFDRHNPAPPDVLPMPPNVLPHLQRLVTPSYFSRSILCSSTARPRPLTEVLISPKDMTPHLATVLSKAPLRKIAIGRSTLEELKYMAKVVPNLPELSSSYRLPTGSGVLPWIEALACFTKLEVLHDSSLLQEFDAPEETEYLLRAVVLRCRILRRITIHGSSQNGIACDITREGKKIHWAIDALNTKGSFDI